MGLTHLGSETSIYAMVFNQEQGCALTLVKTALHIYFMFLFLYFYFLTLVKPLNNNTSYISFINTKGSICMLLRTVCYFLANYKNKYNSWYIFYVIRKLKQIIRGLYKKSTTIRFKINLKILLKKVHPPIFSKISRQNLTRLLNLVLSLKISCINFANTLKCISGAILILIVC